MGTFDAPCVTFNPLRGQVGPGQRKELRYTAAWQTFGRQQHKVIVKDTDSGYEKALFVSMNVRQPRSVGSQPRCPL
jgi:hypothetical protein